MGAVFTETAADPRLSVRPRATSIRALTRLLRSRGLALVLLALITVAAISGTLVPQKALSSSSDFQTWQTAYPRWAGLADALSLTRVYQSWWFLLLLSLLFLSLLVCTASSARRTWIVDRSLHRASRGVPSSVQATGRRIAILMGAGTPSDPVFGAGPLSAVEDALDRAASVLVQTGYGVRPIANTSALFAEKCRYGVWGTAIFHLSLMVILLGGLYSGATKMAGYFELAEGQSFSEQHRDYEEIDEGPLFREQHVNFGLRLDRLQTAYSDDGSLREIASAVTLRSPAGEVRTDRLSVDRPLSYMGTTIYQAKRHGFAALLSLKDARGNTTASGYVNFPTPAELTHPASNRFPLPGTALQAEADFFPTGEGETLGAESWSRTRPEKARLYLFLRDEQKQLVFQGPLALGDSISVNGYVLSFSQVSRWAGFPVTRDPGLPVIFTGFGLCILGAAMIYLWVPRRIWIWTEPTAEEDRMLCIGGRTDRYRSSLDEEVAGLAARLRGDHGPA